MIVKIMMILSMESIAFNPILDTPRLSYRWSDKAEVVAKERGCRVKFMRETYKSSDRSHFEAICREDSLMGDVKAFVWCSYDGSEHDVTCGIDERYTEWGMVFSDGFPFERALRFAGLRYGCSIRDPVKESGGVNARHQDWAVMRFRCAEGGDDGRSYWAGCEFVGHRKRCTFLRE